MHLVDWFGSHLFICGVLFYGAAFSLGYFLAWLFDR